MSLTKSSAAFDRWMEEDRAMDACSYLTYLEHRYFDSRPKDRMPADDEQPETNTPKGHKQKDA